MMHALNSPSRRIIGIPERGVPGEGFRGAAGHRGNRRHTQSSRVGWEQFTEDGPVSVFLLRFRRLDRKVLGRIFQLVICHQALRFSFQCVYLTVPHPIRKLFFLPPGDALG